MKIIHKTLIIAILALLVSACATIKGSNPSEQRMNIEKMRTEALAHLYKKHPQARSEIQNAAGYAVFSNINTNLIFITTSGGYGVAKGGGRSTYMRMAGGGIGLGAGVRDMQLIIIFKKAHDFQSFIDNGWDVSAQAGASAQSDEQGGHINATQSVDLDVKTYQLTKAGLALEATVEGLKFWKEDDLN